MIAGLLVELETGTIRSVYEFAQNHAERLGLPLPDGWIPTAVMAEIERRADEAGWPR